MWVVRFPLLWLRYVRLGSFDPYVFVVGGVVMTALMGRAFVSRRRIDRDLATNKVTFVRSEDDGAVIVEFLPESGLVLSERGRPADFRTRS